MKYADFFEQLKYIRWFSNVGNSESLKGVISIPSLKAWDNVEFSSNLDERLAAIAEGMDWLPTTRDQPDPFYGSMLKESVELIPNGRKNVINSYKVALKSMQVMDKRRFISGPNDFSEAARGAALYCVRMTAIESLIEKPGRWTDIFQLYVDGYWPCGIMRDGCLVVY